MKANKKQSIVIYQNKLHFCVLFYIWGVFLVLFLYNFQKHLKTFCLLKNSYWKIFLTLLCYSAEHTKYGKINPPQSILVFFKKTHHIQTPHKLLWHSFWTIDQQEKAKAEQSRFLNYSISELLTHNNSCYWQTGVLLWPFFIWQRMQLICHVWGV